MPRVTLYFDDELSQDLRARACHEGEPLAEIIRFLVREGLGLPSSEETMGKPTGNTTQERMP